MKIGILGAGIAGLSAAYYLKDHFDDLTVYEAAGRVGGLARSFRWNGFDCDIGAHRFYTTEDDLLDEVSALVPMHEHKRNTAIYIQDRWIGDPVNAAEVMVKFFPKTSFDIAWSFLFRKKVEPVENFEQLVLNQFGDGLNRFFFKPYSEKLFGIPADQISPAWAKRKLRLGGLRDLVRRRHKLYHKVLYYPDEGGYGAIAEAYYRHVADHVRLNTRLVGIRPRAAGGYDCTFEHEGERFEESFDTVISTLPLSLLATLLGAQVDLSFRGTTFLYVLLDKPRATDYQWFYVADGDHIVNRVTEFKNLADRNAPKDRTVLCLEITNVDEFTPERAVAEMERAGVFTASEILDTHIIRVPKIYPVYDLSYEDKMAELRAFFAGHDDLYLLGRNARFVQQDIDDILLDAQQLARHFAEGQTADVEAPAL